MRRTCQGRRAASSAAQQAFQALTQARRFVLGDAEQEVLAQHGDDFIRIRQQALGHLAVGPRRLKVPLRRVRRSAPSVRAATSIWRKMLSGWVEVYQLRGT